MEDNDSESSTGEVQVTLCPVPGHNGSYARGLFRIVVLPLDRRRFSPYRAVPGVATVNGGRPESNLPLGWQPGMPCAHASIPNSLKQRHWSRRFIKGLGRQPAAKTVTSASRTETGRSLNSHTTISVEGQRF